MLSSSPGPGWACGPVVPSSLARLGISLPSQLSNIGELEPPTSHMGRRIRALLALALLAACAAPRSALAAQPGQPRSALRDAAANPHGRGAHKVHNALELVQMHGAHPLPDPSVRLRVNSTKLKRSGQWFEVRAADARRGRACVGCGGAARLRSQRMVIAGLPRQRRGRCAGSSAWP